MKVIFLDFDGVITTVKSRWRLDEDKMNMIRYICMRTDAKLVLSTSWRMGDFKETMSYITQFERQNLTEKSVHYEPCLYTLSDYTIDQTPRIDNGMRGLEIKAWLDEHADVENYVILDDDDDMLLTQTSHFIQTDSYLGISVRDVEKCISMLGYNSIPADVIEKRYSKECREFMKQYIDRRIEKLKLEKKGNNNGREGKQQ
jgi:hypothetical protein